MKKPTRKKILLIVTGILLVWYIFCLPRNLFTVPYSTVVTDRDGELLGARIADDGQWRFPPRETVPEKLKTCIIEFEDNYYRWHWGVNPLAVGRAAIQNIKAKRVVSGGSTITMQTIRLSRKESRTWYEKIIEMILATRLEFRCSKNDIMALYISHAPYGGNVVGLDAAAWRYFGHDSNELSWAEAATLAVLPNAPSAMHLSKSRDALLKKRNNLLAKLLKEEIIDELTYELALTEELPDEPLPLPQTAPHLVDYYFASRKGRESVTTINKSIQLQVEQTLTRWNNEFSRSDIRNMAALVIDNRTNEVVAYCGNARYGDKKSGSQVDIIRSQRSTGSILKPFLYYTMLDEGEILPHTLLADIPLNINGFAPQNFNLQFEGAVSASQAISRSLNIPAVLMLRKHGVPRFHLFLKEIGISTLNKVSSHYGLSLILGGAEATLWDVTNAYSQMGRTLLGLERTRPALLRSDVDNRETLPNVFHPGSVWQTFQAIKEVNRPEEIDWRMIPSMQTVAWKTGTSYGFRDAWAVGVTPRYTVGVWVGNATGEGKPGLVGARTAGPVMFDIFNVLPSSQWFAPPYDEFIEAETCKQSGHLKGRFCEETDTILVVPNGLRTVACPYHHQVNLTADGKFRVYEDCIGEEATIQTNWFTLPPAWEWYYKQRHSEYKTLPPFKKGCGEDSHNPMQFIYPQMGAQVYLPKQLDGSLGEMTFELVHSNHGTTVFWHLDNDYVTSTEDFHKITLRPLAGKHSMTVVDVDGNTLSVTFWVR